MNNLSKKKVILLQEDIAKTVKSLNLDEKRKNLSLLKQQSLQDDFWKDSQKAQDIMSKIAVIQEELDSAKELQEEIASLLELVTLLKKDEGNKEEELEEREAKQEAQQENELLKEYTLLKEKLEKFSLRKFLSQEHDILKATLSINAGQGGTESNDWVQMLYRMYSMFFEKQGWEHKTTEITKGSEVGLSSVTIVVQEPYAFGMLKKEHGVHRLVRISPYNAQGLRQTTFAAVEVLPIFENQDKTDTSLRIPDKDVDFKAVRSSGPGGQSVNKTSSAVQLTHIPTGITVHTSEHKSQAQNRERATEILRARLWRIKEERKIEKISEILGEQKVAGWGNQIRNYILHPYKLVKDLRTGVESNEPDKVLDGELEEFLEAQVRLQ